MQYEAHELSLAFPDMPAEQFRRLAEDVKAHGLLHDIVLLDGKILDGRHRYRACIQSGVVPRFRAFAEGSPDEFCGGDPVAYVTSENAARRQLSPSQLAHAVAAMADYEKRKALARRQANLKQNTEVVNPPLRESGKTAELLAAKAGVGEKLVRQAIKVREQGTPELNAAVAAGEIKVNQAEKLAALKPESQRQIVAIADKAARDKEAKRRLGIANSKKSASLAKAVTVTAPGSEFVRHTLGRIEHLASAILPGQTTRDDFVSRFVAEFDFSDPLLSRQLERCLACIDALTYLRTVCNARMRQAA